MESLNGVNAITIVFASLCIFAIAYRFYGLWVAQKVLNINAARETPANRFEDGKDYVPTNKYVLFGHHFAAIAAAGPLLGPVLAAQFGYLPGLLWILIGCVLAGGVHDMVVLFCSVRHRGEVSGYIASQEIDTTTGRVAAWAVLAILLLTLAGLSIAVVNAMHNSLWSTYTVFCTIPIAILMGLYMQVWRKGDVRGATIMGVVLLFLCILSGPWVASHPEYFGWLDIDKPEMSLIIRLRFPRFGSAGVAPAAAARLPLHLPEIGTIVGLAIGILIMRPTLTMPALTKFVDGTGPVWTGNLFPFLFITIACGAVSGFHALISSGTTPKMLANESQACFIGYGGMLMESFVAIMALVAACIIDPGVYFAMNSPMAVLAPAGTTDVVASAAQVVSGWGFSITPDTLHQIASEVGEQSIISRAGGAPTLAVGMAYILHGSLGGLMDVSFWYHFAILFEALFILTAVDAGTARRALCCRICWA